MRPKSSQRSIPLIQIEPPEDGIEMCDIPIQVLWVIHLRQLPIVPIVYRYLHSVNPAPTTGIGIALERVCTHSTDGRCIEDNRVVMRRLCNRTVDIQLTKKYVV